MLRNTFDVITEPWDEVEKLPTSPPIEKEDGSGQKSKMFLGNVFLKVCEAPGLTNKITEVVENCRTVWNNTNPTNQIPKDFQLIYTKDEVEAMESIQAVCENERAKYG